MGETPNSNGTSQQYTSTSLRSVRPHQLRTVAIHIHDDLVAVGRDQHGAERVQAPMEGIPELDAAERRLKAMRCARSAGRRRTTCAEPAAHLTPETPEVGGSARHRHHRGHRVGGRLLSSFSC